MRNAIKGTIRLAMLACAMLLAACGDSENEYTVGACYFIFDNSTHQDATLASAMNPAAPGTFCMVTMATRNGATYFDFSNNAGLNSSQLLDGIDKRRTLVLGFNNGIIVGYGALSTPPVFYAFDRECPNCYDPNAIPVKSKPLSISSNGLATCKVCNRKYDLNNDGFISSGDNGKRLTRYHANTTGPFGILSVN